jgi:transcriptional regulator with XRE-family HTH domain
MNQKFNKSSEFGVILRKYRLEKGLTQEQLSERVNVVRSFICMLESGKKRPSLDMFFLLAEALDVNPGEFASAVAARIAQNHNTSSHFC